MTLTLPDLVPSTYVDAHGTVRTLDPETRAHVDAVVTGPGVPLMPLVCSPGESVDALQGELLSLDGESLGPATGVAPGLGYYRLVAADGGTRLVICAPDRFPEPARGWGWAVQLYAARTRRSWGIGDFADLAVVARSAQDSGAGCVLISPVHAAAPVTPQQSSPYSPASRQWLQVLHIAVEEAPGAQTVDLTDLAERARRLNDSRLIDRDAVWALKREALERVWLASRDGLPAEHERWVADGGTDLRLFATWCVLAERFGTAQWRSWPEPYRTPAGAADLAAEHADRVDFYCWLQWVADLQLGRACRAGATVVADVAVGFDSSSADAWVHQALVSLDYEVGCPPDKHNIDGQKWGLPPIVPTALVAADLAPFVAMVRAALRHAGALRIDHVMQLWRLYWVPMGGHAGAGVYVRYPVEALLAVLRLEAARTGAWVVGEDMGTVADGVRETMAEQGMLGYRAALRLPVDQFPEPVMGASSTHDQATVAGTLTGSDNEDLRRIGKPANFTQLEGVRRELADAAGVHLDEPIGPEQVAQAVRAQYARLSACRARVVLASLDDAGAVAERPNMPGTVTTWPNWCLSLPRPVDDLLGEPLARDVARILDARRG